MSNTPQRTKRFLGRMRAGQPAQRGFTGGRRECLDACIGEYNSLGDCLPSPRSRTALSGTQVGRAPGGRTSPAKTPGRFSANAPWLASGIDGKSGFTLIETLVAITVLVIAIIGPMTIAARGLQSAFYAKEELTAVYLAQEGVELMRMRRDDYALENLGLATDDWRSAVDGACSNTSGCGVDSLGEMRSCSTAGSCKLLYNSAGDTRGMYAYSGIGGVESAFTRVIQLEGDSTQTIVTVTVTWQSNFFAQERSVTLQSRIFNHYDDY